ncbi:hypothetical protein BN59_01762 [Legionella massiliensis]|uniref:Uncharacterized protein n=1 Tax=Legionella massiliensis TaxID=1034943 RepID=A0A078L0B1_9GAMM|nr:hypothetical protein [Legionella massiliensis]CDZ77479.1 hypothetical protein BN59_01762 [Legionella massiliensis]CEE13217.1 hypothetical protein BN1094_01762 [Legionella massiliensis]
MRYRLCDTAYPTNKELLRTRLLEESTTHPLKHGLNYFSNYLAEGGQREHPILGDLADFIDEVKNNWDINTNGTNFVVALLEKKFDLASESTAETTLTASF